MKDLSNISVVLPSLDPDEKLHAVIEGLLEYGFTDIILINDGSKPENLHYFEDEVAAHPDVIHLLHHEVNKGKGAALKNAFTWFLKNRPKAAGVVTVDGDNQHHPADTRACCEKMLETGKMVLGCRDFSLDHVPARSRFGNRTTSAIFKIFVGMTISDTQTGLRAIPKKELKLISTVKGDRFEYETNMLLAMKQNCSPFEEVKIRTVYIEENASSHFHPIRDSWRIYKLLLGNFFKFMSASLVSTLVDLLLFTLLGLVITFLPSVSGMDLNVLLCTAIARVCSAALNFKLNQSFVFNLKKCPGAVGRYILLSIGVMIVSGVSVSLLTTLLPWLHPTLIKVVVDTLLFFVNYRVQRAWVFPPEKAA